MRKYRIDIAIFNTEQDVYAQFSINFTRQNYSLITL